MIMEAIPLHSLRIGIKGAGEMASSVAWRLYMANMRRIFMMDVPCPLAVRRQVSFCEAIHERSKVVEGVEAIRANSVEDVQQIWTNGNIAVLVDPKWASRKVLRPDVMIDAIVAKKNLGTKRTDASLVIGLGPGFVAASDVHIVIETNRGHNLGRIISSGSAEANTGIPGSIGGYSVERVLRAPVKGLFIAKRSIGDLVEKDEVVGIVEGTDVRARINGVIRGLIRSGVKVNQGLKLGDIDPRGDKNYCFTISDKARSIGGSVLEAILRVYNK